MLTNSYCFNFTATGKYWIHTEHNERNSDKSTNPRDDATDASSQSSSTLPVGTHDTSCNRHAHLNLYHQVIANLNLSLYRDNLCQIKKIAEKSLEIFGSNKHTQQFIMLSCDYRNVFTRCRAAKLVKSALSRWYHNNEPAWKTLE